MLDSLDNFKISYFRKQNLIFQCRFIFMIIKHPKIRWWTILKVKFHFQLAKRLWRRCLRWWTSMLRAGKLPKLKKMAKSWGEGWKSCQNFVQDFVQPIFLKFPTWVGCCPTFVKKQGGCGIALMQIQHFFAGTILHLLHLNAQNIVFGALTN